MTFQEDSSPSYRMGDGFRVGAVLNSSWSVYARNFVKFVLLAAIPLLPSFIANFYNPLPPERMFVTIEGWSLTLVGILLGAIIHAASSYGVYEDLRGSTFAVGNALGAAARSIIPILFTSLLTFLIIELGFILLVVPGIMMACRYFVAIPACVTEQLGPLESMKRSAQLTNGYRWPIFGLMAIIYGASAMPGLVLSRQLAFVGPGYYAYFLILMAFQLLIGSFITVVTAVSYFRLRLEREGVDISQLTTVFD